ncbi:MAG: ABC transporter permease DevC [Cyanobacteriota bacterium]|nr:ABC transporter permease DevC [Cyanobacteriota bacterium]
MLTKWLKKTPVAWLQLTRNKTRFTVALAGIAFADLLIFLQMGFEASLYESSITPHKSLQADLVLVHPKSQALISMKPFPREKLQQSLALSEVDSVSGVAVASAGWRNPETRSERQILVWGIDPDRISFDLPAVRDQQRQLQSLNTLLYDQAGRSEYGRIAELWQSGSPVTTELNDKQIRVAGLFSLGASFAADGNVITSHSTFLRLFPERQAKEIEIGLIQLTPEANIDQVKLQLQSFLSDQVKVLTLEEFGQTEKKYWETSTAIGFIFGIGVGMGLIVGIVIVYQILYSDVNDHLPQYATLKAMGYTDHSLLFILMQEATLLALLGFIPGFLLSAGLYEVARLATMLPIGMTVSRASTVLVMTLMMCLISGTVAMGKLRSADPADVF